MCCLYADPFKNIMLLSLESSLESSLELSLEHCHIHHFMINIFILGTNRACLFIISFFLSLFIFNYYITDLHPEIAHVLIVSHFASMK
jgi:hypothetical protein